MTATIRKAGLKDIDTLATHHNLMFEEIYSLKGNELNQSLLDSMYKSSVKKLSDEMPKGICVAWIIEKKGQIVGSGAISKVSMTSSPLDLRYIKAYLHSIYVIKDYRGKGLTKILLREVNDYCKTNNIGTILLLASDAGRPIYESVGYKKIENFMSLYLN